MNVRGEVHAYLPPEHYRRVKLEAAARQLALCQCVADCLREYFALRQEMATALETLVRPGELSRRVIHVLLAESGEHHVATFERYVDDLAALRGRVDALLAMADRAEFLALRQTPEVPAADQARALASGPAALRALAPGCSPHAPRLKTACAVAPGGTRASRQSRGNTAQIAHPRLTEPASSPYSRRMDYRETHHHRARQAGRPAVHPRAPDHHPTIYDVLDYLASGMSQEGILRDFPRLGAGRLPGVPGVSPPSVSSA